MGQKFIIEPMSCTILAAIGETNVKWIINK